MDHHCYCVSIDNNRISVGIVKIVDGELQIDASKTADSGLPLYPYVDGNQISDGSRVILTLLSATDAQLGYIPPQPFEKGIELIATLGMGSFSTVYSARHVASNTPLVVKAPQYMKTYLSTADKYSHIEAEVRALTLMAGAASNHHIPVLADREFQCLDTLNRRWVAMVQVTTPLDIYLKQMSVADRQTFARGRMLLELTSAVDYAIGLNVSHNDIRHDNIHVIIASGQPMLQAGRIQLNDWGLSTPLSPDVPVNNSDAVLIHGHMGGLLLFHADIVRRGVRVRQNPLKVIPAFDRHAVTLNCMAVFEFDAKMGFSQLSWRDMDPETMIQTRNLRLNDYGFAALA